MDIEGPSTATFWARALLCLSHVLTDSTRRNLVTAGFEGLLSSAVIATVAMLTLTDSSEEERRAAVVTAGHR